MSRFDTVLFDWPHLLFVIGINRNASNSRTPAKLTFRAYPNNRVVMRPSENLSAYGGVPPLGVLRKESLGLRRGQGDRPKMSGRRQASLARRGFLYVENVFAPTTQASGFAAGPEFTPDVSSLAFFSLPPRTTPLTYCRGSAAIERVIWIGS